MHVWHRPLLLLPILFVAGAIAVEAQPQGTPIGASRPQAQAPDRAFLGAYTDLIDPEKENSGLVVTYTYPHSTAREIELLVGDKIIALNNVLIKNRKSFVEELRNNNVGGTIRFLVRRGTKKVTLKGKISGYRKTMGKIQADLRKKAYGKPFAKQPPMRFWDPKTKNFAESKDPLAHLKGKIGLVVWYDDCEYCQKKRYDFLAGLHLRTTASSGGFPLAFAGVYYSDQHREKSAAANLDGAASLYTKRRPAFPAAVVHYAKEKPEPKTRHESLYIFNHGVAILDPDGKVAYLQVFGAPEERDIQTVMAKIFVKHFQQKPGAGKPGAGKPPAGKAPAGKPPTGKAPAGKPPTGKAPAGKAPLKKPSGN
jgi:hypothetical protein